ncbi:BZ3500_MvSof-1268-A1-R1_Chr3-3g06599 [Microbotryum saponariae]|uniref:ATP-dependent DNA helicase n=1 Tax=Microbotryum saponariae TaxID=289078 RepID=A0A2X0NGE1_9BASI|nr:BZ3500_MvSof-1268-A1-R1_Chr3-3g06599 [Microbotryum saponariae]SDA04566.1 BZ3501_MvSof-1269-A2-R1_Chr3-2g06286 [Microbotryum saponariae]
MAQGFKTKAPAKAKTKTTQKKLQNKDPKKGARTIPPKRQSLVAQAIVHRKNTSSHHTSLEKTIATQAISHGKLTINGGRTESAQEVMRVELDARPEESRGWKRWDDEKGCMQTRLRHVCMCSLCKLLVAKQGNLAKLMRLCELVVWDEAPMQHRRCFEVANKHLQDVRSNLALFGGVTLALADRWS